MKVLAALFLAVLVQAIAVGQSNDESNQQQKVCAMLAASLLDRMVHALSTSPEATQGRTAASIYGDRYSAGDSTCYMAIEYQVTDNNQRNCSFLTLARVPFKNDADRRQTKAAETRWCREHNTPSSHET